ncbi:DnaD domain protein [Paenibacillus aquistagni]|uniref:Replicative DNA helicase loader DnaB n=1 Tax=Paenibacillus aquistagni TaxID=1852522 RepID=A0A1X7LSE3_9BACL|nr:DnaD domain protein [Paenibacillus aquistagni]SMG56801.1 replicative DNA helicase loader DnaB [Paenibacillus aquistagni]
MRMSNLLHFTEHHHYVVYREFGLSELDQKMLTHVYQPMVGAFAIGLYQLFYQHIASNQTGFSGMDVQRKLFLLLGMELSEQGRSKFIEESSKLEAVGLLQTSRIMLPDAEDYIFEYELQPPLSPKEFFDTQHLTLLLRDKVGKYSVLALREQFSTKEPVVFTGSELHRENISIPFYEIFRLNTHVVDYELEQALQEVAPHRGSRTLEQAAEADAPVLNYSDIIMRFPKYSYNRPYVEKLRYDREGMGIINYIVRKFELTPQETCRLLDEDGVFNTDGKILLDELQHRAHLHFRQNKRRDEWREREQVRIEKTQQATADTEPEYAVQMEYYLEVPKQFGGQCDVHQYNMMLRNTPYTKLLEKFFPGTVPDFILDIFAKLDLNYKLTDEVINVLIHYLMTMLAGDNNQRLNRNFIESIVSNMLLKQVKSYEDAVQYIRSQHTGELAQAGGEGAKASPQAPRGRRGTGSRYGKQQKPAIPIVQPSQGAGGTVSQEELERARELAKRLDANRRSSR